MSKVYVLFADGFEDIEGLTVVDILRRAKIDVETCSVMGRKEITTSHGIKLLADVLFEEADFASADMVVLPGGLKGTNTLMDHAGVAEVIKKFNSEGKFVCAICAAPSVLGMNGLLQGKKAVSYPGFEEKLLGATYMTGAKAVRDGNIITSRGMGTSMDFALAILTALTSEEVAKDMAAKVQFD